MKKKFFKTSLVIAIALGFAPKANSAVTLQNITDLIGKYCYPQSNDCGTAREPFYDTSKAECLCHNSEHQYYNKTERQCQLKCPSGSVIEATTTCPAGMYQFKIKRIDE